MMFWPWPELGVKNGRNHQVTNLLYFSVSEEVGLFPGRHAYTVVHFQSCLRINNSGHCFRAPLVSQQSFGRKAQV